MSQPSGSTPGSSEQSLVRMSVELKLYQRRTEDILIEKFEAKAWEDLVIVAVTDPHADERMLEALSAHLSSLAPDKKFLIVPDHWDIAFYGVEIYERDSSQDAPDGQLDAGSSD